MAHPIPIYSELPSGSRCFECIRVLSYIDFRKVVRLILHLDMPKGGCVVLVKCKLITTKAEGGAVFPSITSSF